MSTENFDAEEIEKFSKLARFWWDPNGELKTLHAINPLRLEFISHQCTLPNKKVLDIGCGGGILTESLYQAGAEVTGIDMSSAAIEAAKLHQLESQCQIEYHVTTAERLSDTHAESYDCVTCLEMLEHVPNPVSIIEAAAKLVKVGGDIFFSTLNRNIKSYLFAIVGAEYILKLLPKQTHDYAKFITPAELSAWCRKANLSLIDSRGISYNAITQKYKLTHDISVNYLIHVKKN